MAHNLECPNCGSTTVRMIDMDPQSMGLNLPEGDQYDDVINGKFKCWDCNHQFQQELSVVIPEDSMDLLDLMSEEIGNHDVLMTGLPIHLSNILETQFPKGTSDNCHECLSLAFKLIVFELTPGEALGLTQALNNAIKHRMSLKRDDLLSQIENKQKEIEELKKTHEYLVKLGNNEKPENFPEQG